MIRVRDDIDYMEVGNIGYSTRPELTSLLLETDGSSDAIRTFLLCWSALVFPPPQAVGCVTALLLRALFVVEIFDISVHVIGLRLIRFYPEEGSHGMRAFSAFSR